MSKDIWQTADITPDPCRILICKTNKGQNYTAIIPSPQEWNTMILPEFYNLGDIDNAERIEQYAYLDDLLALEAKLERTRKALEIAVDALKNVFDYAKIVHSELQKNHLSQFQTPISKMQYSAQQALKQITAIKQKD